MDPGGGYEGGGAFGGGKTGREVDPLVFLKKPHVVLRIVALLSAIIVFGCVSSQGWTYDQADMKEVCILNDSSSACHFPTAVGIIGFLASIGFLVGEWFFEQMSSIKTRKHYVLLDLGFSIVWAFFYLIAFCVLVYSWHNTDKKMSYASSNIYGSMFFSLVSIACWGGSAFFAFQRYQQGSGAAFTQGIGEQDMMDPGGAGYTTGGMDDEGGYTEAPFSGGSQQGMGYQQPTY
ncbi:unnamed protein product [Lepeophtheirus salmonis]|uniref:Synaptogyrin n=1 Tax=Lepeophtheirus salmonis TaxID=72036 RepID=A0A0K2ULM5_LEPSM|nr:synaptogyrin-like isoform X2 [Lepeophtheirus salmonis]CAB4054493.1 unnamed protein product [Lepeophtheirus salmonis]CAF2757887.1 unnamed protein product [Lepeophtheirus salmonis]